MTNRFDINRSQRGIPAFSVLLIILWLKPTGLYGVAKTTKI